MPREVALYTLADRRRLAVTPCITCIWQISGRAEIDFPGQVQLDVRRALLVLRAVAATYLTEAVAGVERLRPRVGLEDEEAEAAGTEWLVVEQDLSRRPVLESIAISYRNMQAMGVI